MVTLKFPQLQNALLKSHKDLKADDPRKGIIVLNNHAIVLRDDFCFVIDLLEYFTIECDIEDDDELNELKGILLYMDGKVFSKEFWTELTKGSNTKMRQGNIYIENPKYAKDLHHKELIVDMLEPLKFLQKANSLQENLISCIAFPFGALNTIYDCMKSDFKFDTMILQFESQDRPIKFTFRHRKHCFGYINPNYDATQEGFRFHNFETFVDSIKGVITNLESKRPPAPPLSESQIIANQMVQQANEEEEDDSQLKLV